MHTASKLIGAAALSLVCAQPLWAQATNTPSPQAQAQDKVLARDPDKPEAARPANAASRRIMATLDNAGPSPFTILLESAHLTPAQQDQVRQILRARAQKNRPLVQQLQATREQISDRLLGDGAVTSADLGELEQQAERLRAQIDHNLIESSVAIRGLLTPDQVSRLAEVHRTLKTLRTQVAGLLAPR